jgi:hypothetical protein
VIPLNKKFLKGIFISILSFVLLILPTVILFMVNYESWVVSGESTKISIGAMLGLLYAVFVMKGAFKDISPKIATLISMGIFISIIWFLDSIMQDLFWVLLSVMIGYIFYIVVSSIGKRELDQYKSYRDEKSRIYARKEAQEDILGV